jgi:hypothetical protein
MALPTFIGIGPGRSGTSWLYEMLDAHPGVAMARGTKETEFFSREYHRGVEWYERFFDASIAARGEISQRYVFDPAVPGRIARLIPDARIIVTLRAPIERMLSVYRYRRRVGTYTASFAEALRADPSLVDENRYDLLLAPYLAAFPRPNILFCLYDDLQHSPVAYLRTVLGFIGAATDPLPESVSEVVNPAAVARSPLAASASRIVATALRKAGLLTLLKAAKRNRHVRGLVLRTEREDEGARDRIPPDLHATLAEALRPAVQWTERETDRDLGHWLEPRRTGSS